MSDDPLATSILFDVFALGQSVGRLLAEAMAPGPLRPEDYAIYSAIFELEAVTPTALAARLGMPLTTLMDHLARLEARDHVRRAPNPMDRRATVVVLSAAGLAAHRAANRHFEAAYAAFVAGLPRGESAAKAALGEIRAAVEQAIEPAGVARPPERERAVPTPRSDGRGG